MAKIDKVDLLDGSYQYAWNGTYMQEQAVRVATVSDIGSGATDAANAMSLARETVQKQYPIAQRYPGGLKAVVFGYGQGGVSESSDIIKVKIIYDTPYGSSSPPGGGTPFVVTDVTSTERVTTGFCPGPKGTKIQTVVWWQNPNNRKHDNVVWPGTFSYDITFRTVTATGIVAASQLSRYTPYSNYVNQNPWNHLGIAYWKLTVQTSTLDLGKNYSIQVQAQADTSKDWSQWINARNPNAANRVIVVAPKEMDDLAGKPYAPLSVLNLKNPVGVIRACPYRWVDFRQIFGFG